MKDKLIEDIVKSIKSTSLIDTYPQETVDYKVRLLSSNKLLQRCLDVIKDDGYGVEDYQEIYDFTHKLGVIGMPMSVAWKAQIKRAIQDDGWVEYERFMDEIDARRKGEEWIITIAKENATKPRELEYRNHEGEGGVTVLLWESGKLLASYTVVRDFSNFSLLFMNTHWKPISPPNAKGE